MARAKAKKVIVHLHKDGGIMDGCDFYNCIFLLSGFDKNGNILNDVAEHHTNCNFIDCDFEYVD